MLEPDALVYDPKDRQCPDDSEEGPSRPAADGDQAVGGIGAGDQHEDHGVIKDPEEPAGPGEVEGVKQG